MVRFYLGKAAGFTRWLEIMQETLLPTSKYALRSNPQLLGPLSSILWRTTGIYRHRSGVTATEGTVHLKTMMLPPLVSIDATRASDQNWSISSSEQDQRMEKKAFLDRKEVFWLTTKLALLVVLHHYIIWFIYKLLVEVDTCDRRMVHPITCQLFFPSSFRGWRSLGWGPGARAGGLLIGGVDSLIQTAVGLLKFFGKESEPQIVRNHCSIGVGVA